MKAKEVKEVNYEIASRFYSDGIIPVDAVAVGSVWRAGLVILTGVALLGITFLAYQKFLKRR